MVGSFLTFLNLKQLMTYFKHVVYSYIYASGNIYSSTVNYRAQCEQERSRM